MMHFGFESAKQENCVFENSRLEISRENYFEIPLSKSSVAIERLSNEPFLSLSEKTAKYYLGEFYSKPQKKNPFLVRAVTSNGGTGNFFLYWCGESLVITYSSLGKSIIQNKTALIVNLSKAPKTVYWAVDSAE